MPTLHDLPTPALLLDVDVLERNLARMAERARALGVALRPHIKTHKCVETALRQQARGARGITVSTLYEAEVFAHHGFDDITWAFPLIPSRLPQARRLAEQVTLRLVVDCAQAIAALEQAGFPFRVWLEVDCGYKRSGVDPRSEQTVQLARRLADSPRLVFDGILTHSGHAYHARSRDELAGIATEEREVMVELAARLRDEGVAVAAVSVGSTPALSATDHLAGVTEIRPGNYAFYDFTQVQLGAAEPRDCALTVLATVVSSQPAAQHCVVDAGALALSKDPGRGNPDHPTMGELYADYAAGTLRSDARLVSLTQELGIVNAPLAVGTGVRILPNHSCLTAACFDEYYVVRDNEVVDRWKIWRGR